MCALTISCLYTSRGASPGLLPLLSGYIHFLPLTCWPVVQDASFRLLAFGVELPKIAASECVFYSQHTPRTASIHKVCAITSTSRYHTTTRHKQKHTDAQILRNRPVVKHNLPHSVSALHAPNTTTLHQRVYSRRHYRSRRYSRHDSRGRVPTIPE